MNRRTLALGLAAWLVVVALGSSLVWAVVSRAGEGVTGSAQPTVAPAGGTTSPQRSGTPHPSRHSSDPRPSKSSGSSDPSDDPTSTSGTTSDPGTPGASGSTAPAGPATVRDSWSGTAGLVIVECTGTRIHLVNAQPRNGHGVEVESSGPAQVEVEFETTGDGTRTKVESVCANGRPVFETATEPGESDD